jgi:hypothetical protein
MAKNRPTSVLVIAILQFIFGTIALLLGLCTGLQLAVGNAMIARMNSPQAAQQPFSQEEFQRRLEREIPYFKTGQYVSVGTDLIISLLMITSGFGLIYMLPWGRVLALLYAVLSILQKIATAIYAGFLTIPVMQRVIADVVTTAQAKNLTPQEVNILNFTMTIMKLALWASVVIPLLTMIYPVVVLVVMGRPSVGAAFRGPSTDSAEGGESDEFEADEPSRR